MDKEINQELLFKLSMFEQQIRQLHEQLQAVENAMVEMSSLSMGLDEIIDGKEVLSPVGRGIFVKSKIISEDLIVDIGSKNFVKKTIPETKELIKNQIKKLEDVKTDLINNLNEVEQEFNKISGGIGKRE